MNPKQRIIQLREELNRHNHNYYVLNRPEITDREFDMMLKELERLESENPDMEDPLSPTRRVGSDLSGGFEHVRHVRPMMSLSNTYSTGEVDEWFERLGRGLGGEKFSITGELKFDGTSISLTYRNGRLVRAVTRGDGTQGDDVTANVKTIRSIPLQLLPGNWPEEFEIRGEILMPWDVLEKLNQERAYNEEPLFANPRNAASGTLKTHDPREVAKRQLDARFYYLLADKLPSSSHFECMEAAREWGFKVSPAMQRLNSLDDVEHFIAFWDQERRKLPVATDGLVFKIDSIAQQEELGYTAKSPRWAIAYKFNPEQACTPLRFVSFETGRMGVVTPVANLEPVLLSGTIVKRASLHNDDIIRQLDIHESDWLYVEKGGEIIPKITGVDFSRRLPEANPVRFVSHCPECGSVLVRVEGEAAWKCPNVYGCPPQLIGKIEHFCARRMMNIDGIGEETARLLFDKGLVRDPADIYSISSAQLSSLDRFGEKMAQRVMLGIEASLQVPFERVVHALSIPNVGETTARRIARAVGSMERLRTMTEEELTALPDVGPIIARSIYEWLRIPENSRMIDRLTEAGLQMKTDENDMSPKGRSLEGKTIVISGTFTHHSRDEYKELIAAHGGKNSGSISRKTSFLLAGDSIGPAKLEKCGSLGIPLVSEEDFLAMISDPEQARQ